MIFHNHIQGSSFSDERGKLNFFNELDLTDIVRMYEIAPSDTRMIRGWLGHKKEKKWLYCHSGSFIVNLVELEDFELPNSALEPTKIVLDDKEPSVLEVSGGYATAFKAQVENSKLLVFSNFSLEASKNDDFRFPIHTWSAQW